MKFAKATVSALLLSSFMMSFSARADKIDNIQKALKAECKRGVNHQMALTLIRPLYLTCVPGTVVQLDKCDVKCLKGDTGMIVNR